LVLSFSVIHHNAFIISLSYDPVFFTQVFRSISFDGAFEGGNGMRMAELCRTALVYCSITSHVTLNGLILYFPSRARAKKTALSRSPPPSSSLLSTMSTELGLDPSDPLNLLLSNGDSSSDESSQHDNPQDWSKFSALWADGAEQSSLKPYSDIVDLSDLTHMSMDMDFNPSMAIEPSALHHFPGSGMNFSYDDQFNAELLSTQFPFMFQFGASGDPTSSSASPQSFTKERRLSVTSSSSSSGASLSPVPESLASPVPGYASDTVPPKEEPTQQSELASVYANDPAAELAQRVRQSAGVMLAVPMNAQLQGREVTVPSMYSTHLHGLLPFNFSSDDSVKSLAG
jgi:hypothetical protein